MNNVIPQKHGCNYMAIPKLQLICVSKRDHSCIYLHCALVSIIIMFYSVCLFQRYSLKYDRQEFMIVSSKYFISLSFRWSCIPSCLINPKSIWSQGFCAIFFILSHVDVTYDKGCDGIYDVWLSLDVFVLDKTSIMIPLMVAPSTKKYRKEHQSQLQCGLRDRTESH